MDARIPPNGLTLGDLFAHYLRSKNTLRCIWPTLTALNESFGSFYEVVGLADNLVQLWDICGKREIGCWNSSGYAGEAGEVWYARVVPPCVEGGNWVTLNTPYVFRTGRRRLWEQFFSRRHSSKNDPVLDLRRYLKHGKFLAYWLEFVFQAYSNYTGNAVFVAGVPDDAASRPDSERGRAL